MCNLVRPEAAEYQPLVHVEEGNYSGELTVDLLFYCVQGGER